LPSFPFSRVVYVPKVHFSTKNTQKEVGITNKKAKKEAHA